jgi:hypothetical protein
MIYSKQPNSLQIETEKIMNLFNPSIKSILQFVIHAFGAHHTSALIA